MPRPNDAPRNFNLPHHLYNPGELDDDIDYVIEEVHEHRFSVDSEGDVVSKIKFKKNFSSTANIITN